MNSFTMQLYQHQNIIIFLLLTLGIFITLKNISVGILYNFCLTIIFIKLSNLYLNTSFEQFMNAKNNLRKNEKIDCGANIPLYIFNAKSITINIDKYNENLEINVANSENQNTEEELIKSTFNKMKLIVKSDVKNKAIVFNKPINDLLKLKQGNRINISGTLIDSTKIFTIVENPTPTIIKLMEEIPYFNMKSGLITFSFSSIDENDQTLIFDKNRFLDKLRNIDKLTTLTEKQINAIDNYKTEIVFYKKKIIGFENLIDDYQNKITANKDKIFKNKTLIASKSDYVDYINEAVEQSYNFTENKKQSFLNKYKELEKENEDLDKINTELNMFILKSKEEILKLNNDIQNNRNKMASIIQDLPVKNNSIKSNQDILQIYDKNYYDFANRCRIFSTDNIKNAKTMQCKYI